MAGLILKLGPNEQLMINGAIIENGDRKTRLRVCSEGAHILRLRNAMKPEDATTPLSRAYYAAQMAVAGQLTGAQAAILVEQAMSEYENTSIDETRANLDALVKEEEYYKVMRALRTLMDNDPEEAARTDDTVQLKQANGSV